MRKASDTSETLDCPADDSTSNATPLTSELDQRRDLYYDASWRLIHEEIDDDFHPTSLATAEGTGGGTEGDTFNLTRVGQILWGVRYIDDAVMRQVSTAFTDAPAEGESPAVLTVNWDDAISEEEEEGRSAKRWWYLTDVQFSVVGLIDPTWGSMVTERVEYSPYGVPLYQPATDFDGDGDVDVGDEFAFLDSWYAQFGGSGIGPGPASADRDRSGAVDVGDLFDFLDAWFADFPVGGPGAPEGWISRKDVPPSMGVQDGPLGPDNPVGYCGYIHNPETGDYTVRFRHYSPRLGRWIERDPLGSHALIVAFAQTGDSIFIPRSQYNDGSHLFIVNDCVSGFDTYGLQGSSAGCANPATAVEALFTSLEGLSASNRVILLALSGIAVTALATADDNIAEAVRRLREQVADKVLNKVKEKIAKLVKNNITDVARCLAANSLKEVYCGPSGNRKPGCKLLPTIAGTDCSIFGERARNMIGCAAARDAEVTYCKMSKKKEKDHMKAAMDTIAAAATCILKGMECANNNNCACDVGLK